jgi:branched-subunit amino acid transport protein
MTGFAPIALLAAACWLVRTTFIVFVPAERLPARVTASLAHVAPAVLAALVSVEVAGTMRRGTFGCGLAMLGCVAVIAAAARRRPNLTLTAGLGIGSVLLLDLVLTR